MEIGLVDLMIYNSIPNYEENKNDKFYYGEIAAVTTSIVPPEGTHEIENIQKLKNSKKLKRK